MDRLPWFNYPSRGQRLRIKIHQMFCRRRHFNGYPNYMVDNFGHWLG